MLRIKLCVGAVAASVACIGGTGSDVQPEVAVAPLAAADTSRNPSWKPNSDTVPSSPPLTPLASLAAQAASGAYHSIYRNWFLHHKHGDSAEPLELADKNKGSNLAEWILIGVFVVAVVAAVAAMCWLRRRDQRLHSFQEDSEQLNQAIRRHTMFRESDPSLLAAASVLNEPPLPRTSIPSAGSSFGASGSFSASAAARVGDTEPRAQPSSASSGTNAAAHSRRTLVETMQGAEAAAAAVAASGGKSEGASPLKLPEIFQGKTNRNSLGSWYKDDGKSSEAGVSNSQIIDQSTEIFSMEDEEQGVKNKPPVKYTKKNSLGAWYKDDGKDDGKSNETRNSSSQLVGQTTEVFSMDETPEKRKTIVAPDN